MPVSTSMHVRVLESTCITHKPESLTSLSRKYFKLGPGGVMWYVRTMSDMDVVLFHKDGKSHHAFKQQSGRTTQHIGLMVQPIK